MQALAGFSLASRWLLAAASKDSNREPIMDAKQASLRAGFARLRPSLGDDRGEMELLPDRLGHRAASWQHVERHACAMRCDAMRCRKERVRTNLCSIEGLGDGVFSALFHERRGSGYDCVVGKRVLARSSAETSSMQLARGCCD